MSEKKYITLEPEYGQILRLLARQVKDTIGLNTAISILEVTRYLHVTDPMKLVQVLEELKRQEGQAHAP
jgi:hypothetical protein